MKLTQNTQAKECFQLAVLFPQITVRLLWQSDWSSQQFPRQLLLVWLIQKPVRVLCGRKWLEDPKSLSKITQLFSKTRVSFRKKFCFLSLCVRRCLYVPYSSLHAMKVGQKSQSYSVSLSDSENPPGCHIQWTPTVTLTVVQIYQGCTIYTSQVSPLNTILDVRCVLWPTEWPGLLRESYLMRSMRGDGERSNTGPWRETLLCSAPFWCPFYVC